MHAKRLVNAPPLVVLSAKSIVESFRGGALRWRFLCAAYSANKTVSRIFAYIASLYANPHRVENGHGLRMRWI